jgi:hypothetical protein
MTASVVRDMEAYRSERALGSGVGEAFVACGAERAVWSSGIARRDWRVAFM